MRSKDVGQLESCYFDIYCNCELHACESKLDHNEERIVMSIDDTSREVGRKTPKDNNAKSAASTPSDWPTAPSPKNSRQNFASPTSRCDIARIIDSIGTNSVSRWRRKVRYPPVGVNRDAQRDVEVESCEGRLCADMFVNSKVPYHHGTPHLHGHDGLLPHDATAASASAAEYAQVRSDRYDTPAASSNALLHIAPARGPKTGAGVVYVVGVA
jgi:hypothetical protein